MTEKPEIKSVYRLASESGAVMGLWLSACSLAMLAGSRYGLPSAIPTLMLAGVLPILLRAQRRVASQGGVCTRFSALWLGGIYTFIFASLICSLSTVVYLLFIDPSFISDMTIEAIESFRTLSSDSEQAAKAADTLEKAVNGHLLPTPFEFVASLGWTTACLGSFLSMFTAPLAARQHRRNSRTADNSSI